MVTASCCYALRSLLVKHGYECNEHKRYWKKIGTAKVGLGGNYPVHNVDTADIFSEVNLHQRTFTAIYKLSDSDRPDGSKPCPYFYLETNPYIAALIKKVEKIIHDPKTLFLARELKNEGFECIGNKYRYNIDPDCEISLGKNIYIKETDCVGFSSEYIEFDLKNKNVNCYYRPCSSREDGSAKIFFDKLKSLSIYPSIFDELKVLNDLDINPL